MATDRFSHFINLWLDAALLLLINYFYIYNYKGTPYDMSFNLRHSDYDTMIHAILICNILKTRHYQMQHYDTLQYDLQHFYNEILICDIVMLHYDLQNFVITTFWNNAILK